MIGGAAGAFPPLVGWAAVTGRLDLAAVYLFAIIFYWTPPHFWALALIKQADYARAGIPMMPVVRGEARTKYEMLVYTLILLPLTVLPFFFGALGPFYVVAAALLGARLLWYCLRRRAGAARSRRSPGGCTGTRCSTWPCSSSPWAWTGICRSAARPRRQVHHPRSRLAPDRLIPVSGHVGH